jgi:hypothetical protein
MIVGHLIKAGPDRAVEKRSDSDGRFIPLCALDAGLSDRDRFRHRSIGLVMSTRVGFCPNLGSYDLTSKAVSVVPQGTTRSRLIITSCVNDAYMRRSPAAALCQASVAERPVVLPPENQGANMS